MNGAGRRILKSAGTRTAALALTGALLSGCGVLYTNVRVPRSYRSATPVDIKALPDDPVASGEACSRSVLFLFAWGDAGYAAASRKALKEHPEGTLYDVKADMRAFSLLGLYTQTCTLLTAKVSRP